MFSEQNPAHVSSPEYSPENDAFIDTLVQRLMPPVTREIAHPRTRLLGMSLALSLLSLVALTGLTYLFLSMGGANLNVGGVRVGNGLDAAQQLFGIGITSLAVVLINVVFSVVLFRGKQ